MKRDTALLILQIFILLLVVTAVPIGAYLLLRETAEFNGARLRSSAFEFILEDARIRGERQLNDGPLRTKYELDDGGSLYEVRTAIDLVDMHVLIRLGPMGEYRSHAVVSVDNPVNGWDRGNGYAESMLSTVQPEFSEDSSGTFIYQQSDLRKWARELTRLISLAGEYR